MAKSKQTFQPDPVSETSINIPDCKAFTMFKDGTDYYGVVLTIKDGKVVSTEEFPRNFLAVARERCVVELATYIHHELSD